jgi:hypothetical protein
MTFGVHFSAEPVPPILRCIADAEHRALLAKILSAPLHPGPNGSFQLTARAWGRSWNREMTVK